MSEKRIAVFVDWANVFRQVNIDVVKFRQFLDSFGSVVYACVYMVDFSHLQKERDPREAKRSPQGYWDLVRRVGFQLRLKRVRVIQREGANDLHKANWDVGMTVDMMKATQGGRVDEIVLFSGDGDFEDLIREVRGLPHLMKVTVCARGNQAAGVLRYCTDRFINLDEHLSEFSRPYEGRSRREVVEEAAAVIDENGAVPVTTVTATEEVAVSVDGDGKKESEEANSDIPEFK